MPHRLPFRSLACWMLALAVAIPVVPAEPKHTKNITDLDGGVFLDGAGELPGGACFEVKGHLTAPDFFDNLKREDTESGTLYRRGNDIVTGFPKSLQLTLVILDMPCELSMKPVHPRVYLTDAMVRTLRLSFFWKHELSMRPARGIAMKDMEVSEIAPMVVSATDPVPQRYEWLLRFDVPSDGVPITDSLVLLMRTPDHHMVARTAARL